jgi:PIN domain nuclease of toxin-antitoxin system
MNGVILDASAVLAFLQDEPGGEMVRGLLSRSFISAVNWSEVIQKCVANEVDTVSLWEDMAALGVRLQPYTLAQAEIAGRLWPKTREFGLSLGDRACLALGLQTGYPVITADKVWQNLDINLEIRVIRA